MPRVKKINTVVTYSGTDWVVNDLGFEHKPRFELYNTKTKEILAKSNNPVEFSEYKLLVKIYGKDVANNVRAIQKEE